MKKLSTFLLLFISITSYSQKQANTWYFGQNAGIDFNGGTATAISGPMAASGGTSAISDSMGNILFYTDGSSVWNRAGDIMPNGTGLNGGFGTQPALIVPYPGNADLYFVFTTDAAGGPNGFEYSVVDMSLLGDSGDVILKNVPVYSRSTEKISAVKHANGTDYWVMMHEFGTDAFRAYLINSSGFNTSAVISHAGIVHDSTSFSSAFGQMKFSPCGTRLASAVGYLDTVDVLDFDATTGLVSNPISIPFDDHVYGVEFSDDNSKLYVSSYDANGTLQQYDLSPPTAQDVIASKTVLSMTSIYGLQLATDGKIYIDVAFSSLIGVINLPDVAGSGCSYDETGFNLDPASTGLIMSGLGLPGFVQSYFIQSGSCLTLGVPELHGKSSVSVSPNPSSGKIVVSVENIMLPAILKVMNSTGQTIAVSNMVDKSIELNLPNGFYFLSVENKESKLVEKLVVY